jgi:hypothetical protein
MNWREVYQLPLFYYGDNNVWSNNGTAALTFFDKDCDYNDMNNFINKIVNKLNGDSSIKFDKTFTIRNNIHIHYNGIFSFSIIGWGKLIGECGYNISLDEASEIQENFANWILNTLNN